VQLVPPPVGPEDQAASSRLISVSNSNRSCARIFKRGIVGSFHKVSRKYMPLYVAEFQFRYNNRHNSDIFGKAIAGC
jgi:ISXO2-like transposase domain